MQNKNIISNDIDWIVYDSFQNHCTRVKELQEKFKAEGLSQDESKELTYHKDRIDCIKRFAENKKVPVVYVPDECFDNKWQRPDSYGKDYYSYDKDYLGGNPLFNDNNNCSELLYPKWCRCTNQESKDALTLDSSTGYWRSTVAKDKEKYSESVDLANPYLPYQGFLLKQRSDCNDCWLLSIIIGIIDHNAKYIPNKMVRDYPENNQDKSDDNTVNVNENIGKRPDRAVVRLHDEDGLPVDIVVDKTRPNGDKRPLWIIMLEKAVCVMMGINKFKNCYNKPSYDMYQCAKGQRTVLGIDWNNIGSLEKDGSRKLSSNDIEKKFDMQDINHGLESVGIQIILGKNNKRLDSNNKNNTVENIQQNLMSEKLVLIGTGNNPGDLRNSEHVLYLKNINNDKMSTIDSISGKLSTSAKNNIKSDTVVHVSDFPASERSIENEIDQQKINKIETDILRQKEDILKANVTNNNKEKDEDNSSKSGIDSNKDGKSNNPYDNLEPQFNNNNQVDNQDKRENNKEENIYIANKKYIEQINSNDNGGKSETEETRNSSQSSSTQKPSNKFKNIGIAAIILGVLGFVITLIIKLLLIETLSLLVVILPPLVPIVIGIIFNCYTYEIL